MAYSFTSPQPKRILLKITRIWLLYVALTFGILLFFTAFLQMQRDYMLKKALESEQKKQELLVQITAFRGALDYLAFETSFADEIKAQNGMLSESVKNLFELIPEPITLQSVEMEKDQLIIRGMTPSKETYSFLLEVPLRSIFHESRADFYALPNGWFSFISVSRLKEEL